MHNAAQDFLSCIHTITSFNNKGKSVRFSWERKSYPVWYEHHSDMLLSS